jgi:serine/threonine protein kinase/Tol biopolymer transport system component
MSPADWQRIESIYHAVLARPLPERAAFLTDACAGNEAVRHEVDSLLAAGDAADSWLKTAGAWPGTTLIGQRLGVYHVMSLLGAGGMGEVYRARDPQLNRDVAIKVLLPSVATDSDRLARFRREAQVLAALNHPNIAHIHGFEDSGTTHALVMELVEGPTLADRIAQGPIPLEEALPIAKQIADALEAAHEQGIVHRDLKPANIKVRADGTVKVLDFGLAKAIEPAGASSANAMNSPTLSIHATQAGMILGTAAYMSPEQARGKAVDRRADIWAFGAVLFEMLTGARAFPGEDVTDTIVSVVSREPDWTALAPGTPPGIRRLLRRCLEKDRKRRLDSASDARLEIEEPPPVTTTAAAATAIRPRRALPWIVAATAGVLAIGVSAWALARPVAALPDAMQFTQLTDTAGEETAPSISPDGTTVMFASRARGTWDIYAQRVGGRVRTLVVGDPERQELGPSFSPDGQQIAFYESDDDGGIFVAGATGESIRRVAAAGFHPSWSPDGTLLAYTTADVVSGYGRSTESRLFVIDPKGGAPRQLDQQDAAQPSWSPSGRRIVFWSIVGGQRDLFTIRVAGGPRVPLTADAAVDWAPVWERSGGHVTFASDRGGSMNLWRIAVDEETGAPLGVPEPVTAGVQAASELPSISRDGSRVAFRSRVASVNPIAIRFDPVALKAGTPVVLDSANSVLVPSDVSRDGKWLVLSNHWDQQEDLFVTSTDVFAPRRLTDDPARDRGPVWLPDGRSLAFSSTRGGKWEIWTVNADGSNVRKAASVADNLIYPVISPAGDRVALTSANRSGVFVVPLSPDTVTTGQPLPGTAGPGAYLSASDWSRDGRALAGALIPPSGKPAGVGIYDLASRRLRQISADASSWVRWLPDSRRVVYLTNRSELVAVDTNSGLRTVVSVKLPLPPTNSFALSPDGRMIYYAGARSESDIWVMERKKR